MTRNKNVPHHIKCLTMQHPEAGMECTCSQFDEEKDNINPEYYKVGGNEVWEYMKAKLSPTELAGAVKFNVIKYVSRCDHKGKVEDLKKARWYLDKLIQEIEK